MEEGGAYFGVDGDELGVEDTTDCSCCKTWLLKIKMWLDCLCV